MNSKKGITLIALVVTIVVLLILAAVSISMLTGENGIITQAQKSDDETEQAKCEELVTLAINGLIAENAGDKSKIMPQDIADEVNRMENRTDVTAEGTTFPTNIIFTEEDRKVGVNIELGVTDSIEEIYNVAGAEDNIAPENIFLYEVIEGTGEIGAVDINSLPTKEARIVGINPKYCNLGGYTSETGEKYEDTNYEIVLEDGTKISDTLVVPYQVSGEYIESANENELYKITEVDLAVYWNRVREGYTLPNVKTIIYPNTVKKITGTEHSSGQTIRKNTIEKIILPRNVEIIGDKAFLECTSLRNIEIPETVISIGDSAFGNCSSLTSIEIPDSITSIGGGAFSGCTSLTSIEIPDSITSIGDGTFSSCTSLTSITMPESVTSIGDNGFYRCTSLTSIIIPESVTSIGSHAFYECSGLTNIEIPDGVTSIGSLAFSDCTNLVNIKIPENVISVGRDAFSKTAWYNNQPDGDLYIGKVYYGYKGTMPNNTTIIIKDGTTYITEEIFRDCSNLVNIVIPDTVTRIGGYTFFYCTNLTSITIPKSVTSIGGYAFSGCTSLTTVNYIGTEEEWNKISIDYGNDELTNAQINFNYKNE